MNRDTLKTILFMIALVCIMINGLLFVALGEITVRKLRNQAETRHALGLELLSGWSILNVSRALARPGWVGRARPAESIAWLFADRQLVLQHTNRIDRWLAVAHYGTLWLTMVWLAAWIAAEAWL